LLSTLENITTHRPKGLPCGNYVRTQRSNPVKPPGRTAQSLFRILSAVYDERGLQ